MELFWLLIKANVCLIVFYLVYKLLLQHETYFKWNRGYIVFALLSSCIIPFVQFGGATAAIFGVEPMELPTFTLIGGTQADAAVAAESFDWFSLILLSGILVVGCGFVYGLVKLFRLRLAHRSELKSGARLIVLPETSQPYSFFSWIFMAPDQDESETVWNHELAHVKGWHSVDGLLAHLFCAFFWYNPVAWLMRRELKSVHEFIADEAACAQKSDTDHYARVLLGQTFKVSSEAFLSHAFYHQTLIFKRIKMLKNGPSKKGARLKYLALPAVMIALTFGAACTKEVDAQTITETQTEQEPIYKVVDVMPEFQNGQEGMMEYIQANFKYPKAAKDAGAEGKVYISFVVSETGEVVDAKVKRGVDPELDQAALDIVKSMPAWTPGVHAGEKVKVEMVLPFKYQLD